MKIILMTAFAIALSASNVFAADLCSNHADAILADQRAAIIMTLAEQQGLAGLVSSFGHQECNPKTFVIAADPGEANSGVVMENICGPIFTFRSVGDLKKFGHTMRYVLSKNLVDSSCAEVNGVSPRK
jgi:hypothetical protein